MDALTYRTFPLPAAQYIAEKYHLPLVIDLRDIVEQYASNEYEMFKSDFKVVARFFVNKRRDPDYVADDPTEIQDVYKRQEEGSTMTSPLLTTTFLAFAAFIYAFTDFCLFVSM